jgi:hypothetical protein
MRFASAKNWRSLREKSIRRNPSNAGSGAEGLRQSTFVQLAKCTKGPYRKFPHAKTSWPARLFAAAKKPKFQRGTPCTTRTANSPFEPQANGQDVRVALANLTCLARLFPKLRPFAIHFAGVPLAVLSRCSACHQPLPTRYQHLGGQISIFWCSVRISRRREILGWDLEISKKHAKSRF